MHFLNFDHLRIKFQSSDLIWGTKFCAPSLPLPHLIFSSFKLLSMASYGGELVLDSSSPWSGIYNHLSSFSIPLTLIFKNQRTPLTKKIHGLQASHGSPSCGIKNIFIYVTFFWFLYLFVWSINFNSLFFIFFSMYLLHCLVVWFCLKKIQKNNPMKS